jgi:SAM-dependent methyltransferase
MEDIAYETESQIEQSHWWFVARRNLFKSYLNDVKRDAAVLDIGSSSGTNLRLLKELGFSNYQGFDYNELSKKFCAEKKLGEVVIGDICNSNLPSNHYDFILATDVIEHIDDHKRALDEIKRILKPEGKLLITVPCFMSLWGDHDVISMHKRRYRKPEITGLVANSGLKVIKSYYFNFFLFLPILAFRKLTKALGIKIESENSVNNSVMNKLFKLVFETDIALAKKNIFPFGVSCLVLATK